MTSPAGEKKGKKREMPLQAQFRRIRAVKGTDVSLAERGNAGMTLARRRLTPAPCWVHPRDTCACTRPVAGRIASRSRVTRRASVSAAQHSGADQRVHEQEVVERPALVAGATSRAQAVNFMA